MAFSLALFSCAACTPRQTPDQTGSATPVEYSENSLIAYHENMGNDISGFTDVSKENCSQCHGEWTDIQAETDGVLEKDGFTANPHANHMTKDLACTDCHSLTGPSTLSCDENCHEWNLTKDNGTWDDASAK